jgi:hypothetical protein
VNPNEKPRLNYEMARYSSEDEKERMFDHFAETEMKKFKPSFPKA